MWQGNGNVFAGVCHSIHGERGCLVDIPSPADTLPPQDRHPPNLGQTSPLGGTPPDRRLLQRTVRILLECILVERLQRVALNREISACLKHILLIYFSSEVPKLIIILYKCNVVYSRLFTHLRSGISRYNRSSPYSWWRGGSVQ